MWLLAYVILTPGVSLSIEDSIGISWVCQTCEQIKQARSLLNIGAFLFKFSLLYWSLCRLNCTDWYCCVFECPFCSWCEQNGVTVYTDSPLAVYMFECTKAPTGTRRLNLQHCLPSSRAKPMFNLRNSGCFTNVSIPLWPPTSSSVENIKNTINL